MKRILALILLLPLLSFAAAPRTSNPNNQTYVGTLSGTVLPAAPYVDANGNLNVVGTITATGGGGTLTDRSGSITTGGTSQTLAPANPSRQYLFIQNPPNATENLYINFTSAASAASGSIGLVPGQSFVMETNFISTELVTVYAATAAHAYTAKEK